MFCAGAVVPTHAESSLLTVVYAPHQPSLTLTLLPDESDFVIKMDDTTALVIAGAALPAALSKALWPMRAALEARVDALDVNRTMLSFKLHSRQVSP